MRDVGQNERALMQREPSKPLRPWSQPLGAARLDHTAQGEMTDNKSERLGCPSQAFLRMWTFSEVNP